MYMFVSQLNSVWTLTRQRVFPFLIFTVQQHNIVSQLQKIFSTIKSKQKNMVLYTGGEDYNSYNVPRHATCQVYDAYTLW